MYHKWQSYDVWFLRYGAWQTEFFVIFNRFLPFYLLTTWKINLKLKLKNKLKFKNWKKHLVISSFYICVPNIMIKWCIVPEIWCVTDGRTEGRILYSSDLVFLVRASCLKITCEGIWLNSKNELVFSPQISNKLFHIC